LSASPRPSSLSRIKGGVRISLTADCFNIFNAAAINRAYDAYYGDAYFNGTTQYNSWVNPTNRRLNEILNPGIFRFGVRFEF
jgi:hypothetical protein